MNFADVKQDDPRWTPRERMVFMHLFRQRQRYIEERRKLEAHGMAKAIYCMANVLEAFAALPTPLRRTTDPIPSDPFSELL
jgi:hypothetical protein